MGKADVSKSEERKRMAVFAKERKTVIIKVLANGVLTGLPKQERDDAKYEAKHRAEAERRGLDPHAYRKRSDTGFCLFEKQQGVRIRDLLDQLSELGLHYVEGFWQLANNKGPVNLLTFSTEGKPAEMPTSVWRFLYESRFNHCTVWCNLNYEDDGDGQFRLDTINLAKGRKSDEPSRSLLIKNHTYRLIG